MSINGIKSRMRSVSSTRQITRAMELVSSSKLRRAKEKAEGSRPFHAALTKAIADLSAAESVGNEQSVFLSDRQVKKTCYVVIAGDRGLAGAYNSNLFRHTKALSVAGDYCVLPIGKKAVEHYRRSGEPLLDVGCASLAAVDEQILPLGVGESESGASEFLMDEDPVALIDALVPFCVSGLLYAAVSEAVASEHGARRNAMSSASKNAGELIDKLQLHYNRARQAAITQEISEIVSGADAL